MSLLHRQADAGAARPTPIAWPGVNAEYLLPTARVYVVSIDLSATSEYALQTGDCYRLELCLTPRQQVESARYVDRWKPQRFSPLGGLSIIPPGERLVVKSEGGERASLICQLDAEAVERWLPQSHTLTDRKLEAMLDAANLDLRDLLQRLSRELQSPGLASEALVRAMVMELSIEVARHLVVANDAAATGGLSAWRLRAIDRRLAKPGPPPSLAELAELCNLSTRQLTRGFRTSRGCSIGDHRAWLLVEQAKLLLATGQSIKAIAEQAGFSSHSAFTGAFRAMAGITPQQYRARTRGRLGPATWADKGKARR